MAISYGDRIIIKDSEGEYVNGTIIDIWRGHTKEITDYIVQFDSGVSVRIKPQNPNWCKLDDYSYLYTLSKAECA
jgi:hypothetical protein